MITKFLKTLISGLPNHTEDDFAQICEETSKNQKILLKEMINFSNIKIRQ